MGGAGGERVWASAEEHERTVHCPLMALGMDSMALAQLKGALSWVAEAMGWLTDPTFFLPSFLSSPLFFPPSPPGALEAYFGAAIPDELFFQESTRCV